MAKQHELKMDFESPDVMKDFPGLYSTEGTSKNNDSDYSDDSKDKATGNELLIGKKKLKKDNKKDGGYAALESESSAEEEEAKSPSKTKKTKSFKFSSKTKDKREKKVEKEKDGDKKCEKEKEKEKKGERSKEKSKCDKKDRKIKQSHDEKNNIDEVLPIFGVPLEVAVERGRCHDGVELPLPIRDSIDYCQEHGMTIENIYKVNGIKSKVLHIKKLYNQREAVCFADYDVPTATSLFKLFLRELPEPILSSYLTRFEEAAAVQNVGTREVNLMSLVEKLPIENRTLLAWTILHLDTITQNEKHTKMNAQGIAMTLSPVLQMSHRLLAALLCHCKSLFKDTMLTKYCPPLMSGTTQLPESADDISIELKKQDSLLNQIHTEMNSGFILKKREELLWEVQRMVTQLKRKLRSIQKCNEVSLKNVLKEAHENSKMTKSLSCSDDDTFQNNKPKNKPQPDDTSEATTSNSYNHDAKIHHDQNTSDSDTENLMPASEVKSDNEIQDRTSINKSSGEEENAINASNIAAPTASQQITDVSIALLQYQNQLLSDLKEALVSQIAAEKSEVVLLKYCLTNNPQTILDEINPIHFKDMDKLDEIMILLIKENRILQIKKIDLVREIMEQKEACITLKSKLEVITVR